MLGPEEVTSALINEASVEATDVHEKAGIIPNSIFYLFERVSAGMKDCIDFSIKCSYLEIYNESINDLLSDPPAHNLRIREFPRLGMCVIGSVEKAVSCPEDVFSCLALGTMNRITTATELNQRSSRSHTLFILSVEQKMLNGSTKTAKINLVDLAGSEKISKTGATGQALKEAQNINLSLTTLGRCIKALSSTKDQHIPFRESKLTMILKEALGGNAKTSLICAVSKKQIHVEETKGTLKFAERAKKVQTKATSNVKRSNEELLAIIDQLNSELTALRKGLRNAGDSPSVHSAVGNIDEEIYLKFADLKAKYDGLVEASQFESEKLKAQAEQSNAVALKCGQDLEESVERIEDLNQKLAVVYMEKESLKKTHEQDVFDMQFKMEPAIRELESVRKELKGANERFYASKEQLYEKEQELEQALDQIKMYEFLIKADAEKISSFKEITTTKVSQIGDLEKEINELRLELKQSASNEESLQSSLKRLTCDNEEKQSRIVLAEHSVNDLQTRLRQVTSQASATEALLSDLNESHKRTIIEQQMTIFALNQQLEGSLKAPSSVPTSPTFPRKSQIAKKTVTRLLKEMNDLQTVFQDTTMQFKQELVQAKEAGKDRARLLQDRYAVDRIEELSKRLEDEVAKNLEVSKALKLAFVEEDSLKFRLGKTKGELVSLNHELTREKELCQTFQSELREARSQLDHYKKLEKAEASGAEAEIISEKRKWRKIERSYRSSIDEVMGQLLKLTAENASLSEALTAKDADLQGHLKKELMLESQIGALSEKLQKMEHALKFFRHGNQKNRSSYVSIFSKPRLTPVRVNCKSHLSYSSQSQSSTDDIERTPQSADKGWTLPHRELYGVHDVHSLYVNDDESDTSMRCKNSSAEQSSDEGDGEATVA